MNSILLSKNKYTSIGFGKTDKHSEQQYRLFINRVKLKQKNYTNALIMFVNIFNTFITEKYPDEKDLWLIINNNQTTSYDLLDSEDKIYNISEELDKIEKRLAAIENQKGISLWKPKYFIGNIIGTYTLSGLVTNNVAVNNVIPNLIQADVSSVLSLLQLQSQSVEFTLNTYLARTLFSEETSFKFTLIR